ncbi:hypothetical protein Q5H93_12250 [Hymenobacter sp. ASUV-10]|uniref:Uncharacterized protein n=1 Tax=Hymenobacter aranciens TaxID=3063996 RepID=A0ABT9BB50_9BACT|nr:hypothetical protein [Hymenobacter sp. ASUV-10]MDO7875506.1 hypothetical protein [Hymenobacter sp. ASUV-10]
MDSRSHDQLAELLYRVQALQQLVETHLATPDGEGQSDPAPASPGGLPPHELAAQLRLTQVENEQLHRLIKSQEDVITTKNDVIALLRGDTSTRAQPATPGS